MNTMSLQEWSKMDASAKDAWLHEQPLHKLIALLGMVGDMLTETSEMAAQIESITVNDLITQVQVSTENNLRDVEHCLVHEIENRQPLLHRTA